MAQKEFKVGDRVVVNERNSAYQGRVGTVKYVSGGQYWVKFDDSSDFSPPLYPWWLEPASPANASEPQRTLRASNKLQGLSC